MPQLEHSLDFISSCVSRINAAAMYAIFATIRMKRVLHARRKSRGLWQMYAAPCSSRQRLALSETKNSARRINPISSSHEQRRTLLLESAMPKCSRRFSVQKLWSPCTWYSRYLLVLVFRLLLGIISGYTRLLPDKEAPGSHYNRLPTAAIYRTDKIMHTASDYMCIQFCVIAPTMLCLGRTQKSLFNIGEDQY